MALNEDSYPNKRACIVLKYNYIRFLGGRIAISKPNKIEYLKTEDYEQRAKAEFMKIWFETDDFTGEKARIHFIFEKDESLTLDAAYNYNGQYFNTIGDIVEDRSSYIIDVGVSLQLIEVWFQLKSNEIITQLNPVTVYAFWEMLKFAKFYFSRKFLIYGAGFRDDCENTDRTSFVGGGDRVVLEMRPPPSYYRSFIMCTDQETAIYLITAKNEFKQRKRLYPTPVEMEDTDEEEEKSAKYKRHNSF